MGWENIESKFRQLSESKFILSEDDDETDLLVKFITHEFIWLTESEVRKAIRLTCMMIDAPRPRDEFLECLHKELSL